MDKIVLEKLILENKSTREIACECNCSQTSIRYWIKKYSLKSSFLKSNLGGRNQSNRDKIRQFGSAYLCRQCGETNSEKFVSMGDNRKSFTICKKCHNFNNIERFSSKKEKFVKIKGGKCEKCGYNKCRDALEFHHLDPSKKDPKFASWRSFSDERLMKELSKCILVCSNCHKEIHYEQRQKRKQHTANAGIA